MTNRESILPVRRLLDLPALAATVTTVLLLSSSARAAIQDASSGDWTSTIFSPYVIIVLLIVLAGGLVYYRRRKAKQELEEVAASRPSRPRRAEQHVGASAAALEPSVSRERRQPVIEGAQVWEKPAEVESAFGAYRIDQEVNKLAMGKPHRMDVMSSRAPEDRRAIEASLIKALESSDATDEARRRLRQALDEYGFVARQSATMLMGRDAWERSSAARVLGQVSAPSSLPFLIEALHDNDSVVRNQAISSLGSLKLPAAIGALLDIARRHPDIPASLLSETLSACSVESLGYLDAPASEPALLSGSNAANEHAEFEKMISFDELPAATDTEQLDELLAEIEKPEEQTRSIAAQQLGMHPVKQSVTALTKLVMSDPEPSVRAAAVASLGVIDHESVFAPVLIGLGDESRIVRAAAARTLTSVHFDRADAYVRLTETANEETLKRVADACMQTGLVAQAVDRLASEDRRQAYEAFSLFSMLARARATDAIMDVIENHADEEARLCAVRVLNLSGESFLAPKLRELVAKDGISENVRTALLEVLYKLEQSTAPVEFSPDDIQPVTLHNSP